MVARVTRRLPGFKFEARSPQLDQTLPRMDIAAFVGFAASGPLHTPVAIEDPEQFAEVFGEDATLAWDAELCRSVNAQLGPAVRSFFRNGGERCWVVRVASNEAAYNFFAIPQLAMAELRADGSVAGVSTAFARARSEGSWSDPIRTSSALLVKPFEVISISRSDGSIEGFPAGSIVLELRASPGDLVRGDSLRLSFADDRGETTLIATLIVDTVAAQPDSLNGDSVNLIVAGGRELWLRPAEQDHHLGTTVGSARVYVRAIDGNSDSAIPAGEEFDAEINWPTALASPPSENTELEVLLRASMEHAPSAGTVVSLIDSHGLALLSVSDSGPGHSENFGRAVRILGQGYRVLGAPPAAFPGGRVAAEKLSFELWTRSGDNEAIRLTDLAFNEPHPRFWGGLPTDEQLYHRPAYGQPAGAIEEGRVALSFEKQRSDLTQDVAQQRFPLAGPAPGASLYFAVGMSALPINYLARLQTSRLPLERDGLASFEAGLFLDGELVEPGTTSFAEQADFIRYTSPRPRELRGAHSVFGIEEVTIVSVPDAIHRGWERARELPALSSVPSRPIGRPEWWRFRDCRDEANQENIPLTTAPERGNFLGCDIDPPDPPCLIAGEPDSSGSFTLEWSMCSPPSTPPADARFVLEQARSADFDDAAVIYAGNADRFEVYGRAPGEYFYRVRLESECKTSDWSNGEGVRVSESTGYVQVDARQYSSQSLLAVHRALLRMSAARGDLFAILSLPEHYREDDALGYVKTLKSTAAAAIEVESEIELEIEDRVEIRQINALSLPLSAGEATGFSYAGVYHPWLIGGEESNRFSGNPPDGTACGVIASRALNRGAWIAPANEVMHGPIALTPAIRRERWLELQESQINIIRQDARGFLSLSADTLCDDDDLRPINVRRLLSLLRRLALRLGATYVFEPNDASFRRSVQRGFEAMLGQMFARGAFAGGTPETSFQVVTDESLNTPRSVEQGRFIVELRVAPSLPMTFMTIRLVQTGDRTSILETR